MADCQADDSLDSDEMLYQKEDKKIKEEHRRDRKCRSPKLPKKNLMKDFDDAVEDFHDDHDLYMCSVHVCTFMCICICSVRAG